LGVATNIVAAKTSKAQLDLKVIGERLVLCAAGFIPKLLCWILLLIASPPVVDSRPLSSGQGIRPVAGIHYSDGNLSPLGEILAKGVRTNGASQNAGASTRFHRPLLPARAAL
jgi:hypothetical protein